MNGDNVIWDLINGRMRQVGEAKGRLDRANFVIVCPGGDWSGFRTMQECEAQFPELEASRRPDFYYQVVERL